MEPDQLKVPQSPVSLMPGVGMAGPKMPSLLSNAFIQQQMKPGGGLPPPGGLPGPHINKMGLQGESITL